MQAPSVPTAFVVLALLATSSPAQVVDQSTITRFDGSHEERAQGIAMDIAGNLNITGHTFSDDLPVTPGVVQATLANPTPFPPMVNESWFYADAYVARFNADGSTLLWAAGRCHPRSPGSQSPSQRAAHH